MSKAFAVFAALGLLGLGCAHEQPTYQQKVQQQATTPDSQRQNVRGTENPNANPSQGTQPGNPDYQQTAPAPGQPGTTGNPNTNQQPQSHPTIIP